MKRALIYFLTAAFIVALLSFTMTYTVRFTESAVVTRFGKADAKSVHTEPGLRFKLPYPIDSVTTYDNRVRVLSTKLEQLSTADNRQIVIETFCTWRVKDPLVFFQRFSNAGERADDHYRAAESALRQNLRGAAAQVSKYRMDELFSTAKGGSKLSELEGKMLESFRVASDESGRKMSDYGIDAVTLGVTRVVMTEEVSKAVFDRMKAAREGLARQIQSSGQSQAAKVRSDADASAKRIAQFAERLAQDIRSQGEREAVPYYAAMKENPELAVFQATMDFISTVYAKRTTLVLPTSLPGLWMLTPDALDRVGEGQVPPITPPAKKAAGEDGTKRAGADENAGGQR